MKNLILRLSVMGLAAAAGCAIGCQSSGCGGTNINSNTPSGPSGMSCGSGTYLSGNQCLPRPSASSNATPTSAISN